MLVPPTPKSTTSDQDRQPADGLNVSDLKIRIRWNNDSWVTQFLYGDGVLLEGRQLNVEQEIGFVQSFFWFCEEANSLAYEYKARECVMTVQKGDAIDTEPLKHHGVIDEAGWRMPGRSKAKDSRRSLKMEIRFRNTARGAAGVRRVH
jgi:hypothetical protein